MLVMPAHSRMGPFQRVAQPVLAVNRRVGYKARFHRVARRKGLPRPRIDDLE
jgi:hypothetical protein